MTAREQWSATLNQLLPEARIAGQLADNAGFLIIVDAEPSSDTLAKIEAALQAAGADSWHWSTASGEIKVRAYFPPKNAANAVIWLAMLVFIALFAKSHYDVHFAS